MPDFQSIQKADIDMDGITLTMSTTELIAVLTCAASLARKEQMVNTAKRLENDARFVNKFRDLIHTIKVVN